MLQAFAKTSPTGNRCSKESISMEIAAMKLSVPRVTLTDRVVFRSATGIAFSPSGSYALNSETTTAAVSKPAPSSRTSMIRGASSDSLE